MEDQSGVIMDMVADHNRFAVVTSSKIMVGLSELCIMCQA